MKNSIIKNNYTKILAVRKISAKYHCRCSGVLIVSHDVPHLTELAQLPWTYRGSALHFSFSPKGSHFPFKEKKRKKSHIVENPFVNAANDDCNDEQMSVSHGKKKTFLMKSLSFSP